MPLWKNLTPVILRAPWRSRVMRQAEGGWDQRENEIELEVPWMAVTIKSGDGPGKRPIEPGQSKRSASSGP